MVARLLHRSSFRKIMVAATLSFPLVSFSATSTLAQTEALQFTLINKTDHTLVEFYTDPSTDQNWGDDILASDVLYSGESATVTINDNRETCVYDIMAVWDDGTNQVAESVDICALGSYTYTQ
jgi:hypothetical protein